MDERREVGTPAGAEEGRASLEGRLARLEAAIASQHEALARIEALVGKIAAAPPAPPVAPVVVRVTPLAEAKALPPTAAAAPPIAPVAPPAAAIAPPKIAPLDAPSPAPKAKPEVPPAAPAPEFDLEAWVGGAWLNRIGVAAIVFGVAFFLRYAFDAGWVGPAGKVWTGLLFGAGMIAAGERFVARDLRGFGQGLVGGGIAILYVALYAAFQTFHLVSQEAAFGCMAVTTAAAVALALRHDAQAIAVMGLLGGFATPALLSTGRDAQLFLFTYVLLLDVALIAVAVRRSWAVLDHLVFVATHATLAAWSAAHGSASNALVTLAFALLYGAVFAATPLVRALALGTGPNAVGIGIAIVNAGATLAWTLALLSLAGLRGAQGTATLLLAAAYAAQAWIARGLTGADRRLFHALLGVALVLSAIAVPIQLEGRTVPILWSAQALALVYAGARAASPALRATGAVLFAVAVAWLFALDLDALSGPEWRHAAFLANPRALTYAVAAGALFAAAFISRRLAAAPEGGPDAIAAAFFVFVGHALTLGLLLSETHLAWERAGQDAASESAEQFALSTIIGLYGAGLVIGGFLRASAHERWCGLGLLAITIGKVFLVDLQRLETIWRVLAFLLLGAALLVVSFIYQSRKKSEDEARRAAPPASAAGG